MNETSIPSLQDGLTTALQCPMLSNGNVFLIALTVSLAISILLMVFYVGRDLLEGLGELDKKDVYLSIITGLLLSIWWKVWF